MNDNLIVFQCLVIVAYALPEGEDDQTVRTGKCGTETLVTQPLKLQRAADEEMAERRAKFFGFKGIGFGGFGYGYG